MPTEDSRNQVSAESLAQLLRDDIEHYDNQVRSHLARVEHILLSAFSLGAVAAPVLLNYRQYGALLIIPNAIWAAFFIGLNTMGEMFALAAHKHLLEERLSGLLSLYLPSGARPYATIPWDWAGGYIRRRSLVNVSLQIIYIVGFVVLSVVSLVAAWIQVPHLRWLAIVALAVWALLAVLAAICWREIIRTYNNTLSAMKASPVIAQYR